MRTPSRRRRSPALLLLPVVLALTAAGCAAEGSPAQRPNHHAARPSASASPTTSPSPSIDPHADPKKVAARAAVPVLCWHQLRDWTSADTSADRPYITPPATFRRQLDTLQRDGYHPITPDQLLAHLTTGASLPHRPVLLTFDDSDAGQISVALPALRKHHFTATFFVMTVVLDKKHYFTTDQVRQLDEAGMTIGAHTWDHHRVDRYSGDDWQKQIEAPTKKLAHIVGHPIRYFAYPYGVWSPAAFPHLAHAGYLAAFQLNTEPLDPHHPLFTLRRAIADPYWSTSQFEHALRHP